MQRSSALLCYCAAAILSVLCGACFARNPQQQEIGLDCPALLDFAQAFILTSNQTELTGYGGDTGEVYFKKDGKRVNVDHERRLRAYGHQLLITKTRKSDKGKYLYYDASGKKHGPIYLKVLSKNQCKKEDQRQLIKCSNRTDTPAGVTTCVNATSSFDCDVSTVNTYRSIDGTCNVLTNPLVGAARTAFSRLLPAVYEDGSFCPIGANQQLTGRDFDPPWPSPRLLVQRIAELATPVDSTELTHMHMQWGQFLDHDIDLLGMLDVNCTALNNDIRFCYPIEVQGIDDPNFSEPIPFRRSLPICPNDTNSHTQPREHINRITHYMDASMVYGSDDTTANSLRSFTGGMLRTSGGGKGDLPFGVAVEPRSSLPIFFAGDSRVNEHTGLVIMHTLFVREHNRIVQRLGQLNPCWGDERLYQEARKILGAIIQIITYREYLPAMYGKEGFEKFIGDYDGYAEKEMATISNVFSTAAFRFGHSQIQNKFSRLDEFYQPLKIGPLELVDGFFAPDQYYSSGGTDPILRGLVVDRSSKVDEFFSDGIINLLITGVGSTISSDLASLNIQRGRDHGLPDYRKWVNFCYRKYKVRPSFENRATINQFVKLYGLRGFVQGMDLWLAALAEKHLQGSHIGPTMACLMAETFKAIRDGDRFWWQNPFFFTEAQRDSLAQVRLSRVICDNSDNIDVIQRNSFIVSDRTSCSNLPELNLNLWKERCTPIH